MKIKMSNGKPLSPEDIRKFEVSIGEAIPFSYLEFIRNNDGADPDPNSFDFGHDDGNGITEFIPIAEILDDARHIENLPERSFPFARAECGNFVLLDLARGGAVYYWDHEDPESLPKIADSFESFMDSLEVPEEIELEPGQLQSIWVSPEFLHLFDADHLRSLDPDVVDPETKKALGME